MDDYLQKLDSLTAILRRIVILTVPSVPKLSNNRDHLEKLRKINNFVKSCADVNRSSLWTWEAFLLPTTKQFHENILKNKFYGKKTFRNPNPSIDLIHLNLEGFKLLRYILDYEYLDKY